MRYSDIMPRVAIVAVLLLTGCATALPWLGQHGAATGQAILECAATAEPATCLKKAADVLDTVSDTDVVECADAIKKAEETHDPDDEARASEMVQALENDR